MVVDINNLTHQQLNELKDIQIFCMAIPHSRFYKCSYNHEGGEIKSCHKANMKAKNITTSNKNGNHQIEKALVNARAA